MDDDGVQTDMDDQGPSDGVQTDLDDQGPSESSEPRKSADTIEVKEHQKVSYSVIMDGKTNKKLKPATAGMDTISEDPTEDNTEDADEGNGEARQARETPRRPRQRGPARGRGASGPGPQGRLGWSAGRSGVRQLIRRFPGALGARALPDEHTIASTALAALLIAATGTRLRALQQV